jgi:hypothetical protein
LERPSFANRFASFASDEVGARHLGWLTADARILRRLGKDDRVRPLAGS